MFFKRSKVVNSLTKLFNNKEPTLDEVLENPDLSISLRYEADELIDFIVPKNCDSNNCPILKEILDYALPINKNISQSNLNIHQRNAASLLSTISNRLQTRIKSTGLLKARLEKFIDQKNSYINEKCDFAGHFQRITEAFIRFEYKEKNNNPFDDTEEFITNVMSKINISAYRLLLINLFSDFPEVLFQNKEYQDVMTYISNYIVKFIEQSKDENEQYYIFSMLFQIYQQNERIFTKFDYHNLPILFNAALSFTEKQLYIFESFRIISLIISNLDSKHMVKCVNRYASKCGKLLHQYANKSTFHMCSLFRVFWKFLLDTQGINVMGCFFNSDPYLNEESDVNCFFYIKVVEVFQNMDSKTRFEYIKNLELVEKAIEYNKKLKENSIPNFCILQLIEIMAQPLKDDEFGLSLSPKNKIMFSEKWVQTVFNAKKILTDQRELVKFAKRDFIQQDSLWI